ncbi:MAG: IS21 family transposase [Limisphaerales bacterium]
MIQLGELVMILDLHRQGLSASAIGRQLGLDRKTVAKYVERGLEPPQYGPREPRPRLLGPYEDYLRERVARYPGLTARRLLREVSERGYTGCYAAVRDFVRSVRPAAAPAFEVRFETPPGKQAQVDFAQFRVRFTDEPSTERIVWLFSLVLGHSRLIWARFVLHQDLGTLLRCHMAAFEALGAVPEEILYDRMKTAVTGAAEDGSVVYNRTLVAFARHYGFQPRACRPYRAKTKGKVERPFRYVREDFFLAGSFANLEDLNRQLAAWLEGVANARVHATTRRVVREAFAAEKPQLRPLPAQPFGCVLSLERRVSREGMVSVGGNHYSVPDGTRRRTVEVHTLADEVRIFEAGKLVAVHGVLEGRDGRSIAAGHRRLPPPRNSRSPRQGASGRASGRASEDAPGAGPSGIGRAGEQVARRPLAVYEAVGRRLAAQGGR